MKPLALFLALSLLLAGGLAWLFHAPFGPARETFVEIPAGTGTITIAGALKSQQIIRSATAFELYRALARGTLKAGEYRFEGPLKLADVYRKIARGDVYTRALVIPEGFNIFDIASAVQNAGLASAPDFLAAERRNTTLIHDLSPHAVSLEGYLFPSTYQFGRHATPDQMVAAMVKRFRVVAAQAGLLHTPDPASSVILASLIEKEVNVGAERALVSGVFENRLRLGMPLATDPTVIYAAMLDGRWRGTIYQSDLQSPSPYNTYRHPGLPPGPIASPGLPALQAALHPAQTSYLYFVADAQHHSQFSADLKTHEAQVQAYRKAIAATH